jgi:hypothetical protein
MKKEKQYKYSTFLRSPASRNFRNKLGYANFNLNTIIVGLEGVKQGIVHKPPDLAVHWEVKNTESAAMQARAFATKALLVFGSDAVDHFMRDLARSPKVVKDHNLEPILRGEIIEDGSPRRALNAKIIQNFVSQVVSDQQNDSTLLENISTFYREHISVRRNRPRIEERFDSLVAAYPGVPQHYSAAIRLLVSWRNHHVHGDYSETINRETINQLKRGTELFKKDHSGTDINLTIDNYLSRGAPTLKELSTLISVAHRAVATLDLKIRERANIEGYAVAALCAAYRLGAPGWLHEIWKRNANARERKLKTSIVPYGFILTKSADSKYSLSPEFWHRLVSRELAEVEASLHELSGLKAPLEVVRYLSKVRNRRSRRFESARQRSACHPLLPIPAPIKDGPPSTRSGHRGLFDHLAAQATIIAAGMETRRLARPLCRRQ